MQILSTKSFMLFAFTLRECNRYILYSIHIYVQNIRYVPIMYILLHDTCVWKKTPSPIGLEIKVQTLFLQGSNYLVIKTTRAS